MFSGPETLPIDPVHHNLHEFFVRTQGFGVYEFNVGIQRPGLLDYFRDVLVTCMPALRKKGWTIILDAPSSTHP